VYPDNGPNHLRVTEAGIVGAKMGVNEHGIGLAVNGLVTPDDGESPSGSPSTSGAGKYYPQSGTTKH